ncbi:hypothetical protein PVAP13_9KG424211 [Panicum virgatum]|uniref:Uncharacterized protein n=1 Tax=Panicum virgatum TaxID=38727 RepID=A0A8T0N8Y4_PANVG|nr:hypothetical protein PVAP13_9KG424211 [Panicum virgatum]
MGTYLLYSATRGGATLSAGWGGRPSYQRAHPKTPTYFSSHPYPSPPSVRPPWLLVAALVLSLRSRHVIVHGLRSGGGNTRPSGDAVTATSPESDLDAVPRLMAVSGGRTRGSCGGIYSVLPGTPCQDGHGVRGRGRPPLRRGGDPVLILGCYESSRPPADGRAAGGSGLRHRRSNGARRIATNRT